MVQSIKFQSFDGLATGRVITHDDKSGTMIVQSRNPYGGHNLIVVEDGGFYQYVAVRHGNNAVLCAAKAWISESTYRRCIKHLTKRGWMK